MKKFIIANLFLPVFVLSVFIPENIAKAEGINDQAVTETIPFMRTYDENGNLIASYVGDELKPFLAEENHEYPVSQLFADIRASIYNYSATVIYSNIWVKGEDSFYNPTTITIDPQAKFGSLQISMYKSGTSSNPVVSHSVGGFVGTIHVPLWSANGYPQLPSGYYTIKLVNNNGGEPGAPPIKLNAGQVWYN